MALIKVECSSMYIAIVLTQTIVKYIAIVFTDLLERHEVVASVPPA